jgi:hypothetical protein
LRLGPTVSPGVCSFPTLREVRELVRRDSAFVVEGLIHAKATLIIGEPMGGKSYLTASLASALAGGAGEWLGAPVIGSQRTVAFGLTDPGGDAETVERLDGLGVDGERVRLDRVANDGSADYWRNLAAALTARGAEVFILDNLMGSINGDINSAKDARAFTDGLNTIVDRGVSVVVVHHVAKSGEYGPGKSAMGSQHFTAWARSVLRLERRAGNRRVLVAWGNSSPSVELDLTMTVAESGGGIFTVTGIKTEADRVAGLEARRRTRSKETLDRNAEIAGHVVAHCQGKGVREVGRELAERFGGTVGTHASNLSGRRKYGAMLLRDPGQNRWSLVGHPALIV